MSVFCAECARAQHAQLAQQEVLIKLPPRGSAKSIIEFGDQQHFSAASWESPEGIPDSLIVELYDDNRRVVAKLLISREVSNLWTLYVASDFPLRINIQWSVTQEKINRASYHEHPVGIQQLKVASDKIAAAQRFETWDDVLRHLREKPNASR